MILGKRLLAIGRLVRDGCRVADVGTDHAKLPVWLIQQGKSPCCIACDIMQGPLTNAQKTVGEAQLEDRIDLRLCDGLSAVKEDEVDDIVIAGMGGEMIVKIMEDAPWCRNKHLILQPMTAADKLRLYLAKNGFIIDKETAVSQTGKHYCVMSVFYDGVKKNCPAEYPYVGMMLPTDKDSKAYLEHQLIKLVRVRDGLLTSKADHVHKIQQLDEIIQPIKERLNQ